MCDKADTNDESATPKERLVVEGVADEAMVDSADAEENNDENDDDPPPPAPLGASFAATLGAMPGLRARVEEAADRLERAVEAMEAEASAPSSGVTAELYFPALAESKKQGNGGGQNAGAGAAMTEEEEGAAAARALAAHARACLPR